MLLLTGDGEQVSFHMFVKCLLSLVCVAFGVYNSPVCLLRCLITCSGPYRGRGVHCSESPSQYEFVIFLSSVCVCLCVCRCVRVCVRASSAVE